ncbi:MAG: hypothetical protein LBP73_04065 [Clostridiales Family XIII bacterium]|jgi:hypothetical protein|nr:hypothetical protein [Clostridiales Family XIII bacterium]
MININEKSPDTYTAAEVPEILTLFSEAPDAADKAVSVAAGCLDYLESEEYGKLLEWREFVNFFTEQVSVKVGNGAEVAL